MIMVVCLENHLYVLFARETSGGLARARVIVSMDTGEDGGKSPLLPDCCLNFCGSLLSDRPPVNACGTEEELTEGPLLVEDSDDRSTCFDVIVAKY